MYKRASITLLLLTLTFISSPPNARAFDILGLQPLQPYGTFSSFSAYTLGKDRSAFMLYTEKSIDPNFYRISINAGYGLSNKVDILANLPFIIDYLGTEGVESFNFGFKHTIRTEERLGPTISYLLSVSLPGEDQFLSSIRFGGGLLVSKKLGPFSGHINLTYYKPTESSLEDEIDLRMGFDLAAGHNFNLLSELIVRKSHFSGHLDLIEGRLGYRVRTSSSSFAALGLGYDFKNRVPELRLFIAFSMIYPLFEQPVKWVYGGANP